MSVQGSAGSAMRAADEAGSSDALENLARIGLVAYGVVHLLVAWLAVQLAWFGGSSGEADQSGAMRTLADSPVGTPLLWVLAAGLIALATWQAAEVLRWRHGWSASGKTRAKALKKSFSALARAVVYIGLGVLAIRFATGNGQSSSQSQQQTTQGVFSWPFGQWLVAVAGLVLVGVGAYHAYKGLSKRFLDQIDLAEASTRTTRLVTRLGQVGFPAKGVALAVVGGLLVYAAITFDPSQARGLDGAMRTILQAPFGRILLTLVALGIAAFGAFSFVRARYPERT
jgi:succinate dehydrogenase/fumarate reductase cytochrome b subunit